MFELDLILTRSNFGTLSKRFQFDKQSKSLNKEVSFFPSVLNSDAWKGSLKDLKELMDENNKYPKHDAIMPVSLNGESESFKLVSSSKMEQLRTQDNADLQHVYTRTKSNFTHSNLMIIDFDHCPFAPAAIAQKTLKDNYERFLQLYPELRGTECLLVPSSSNSIYHEDTLLSNTGSGHIYFLIEDPENIPSFLYSAKPRLINAGLSWEVDTTTGKRRKYLFDLNVFSSERLFLIRPPELGDGLQRRAPEIEHIEGKAACLGNIHPVSEGELIACIKKIDAHANLAKTAKTKDFQAQLNEMTEDPADFILRLDTVITLSDRTEMDVNTFLGSGKDKVPCFSPMRSEKKPSAFLAKTEDGIPFIHDTALNATQFLNQGGQVIKGFISQIQLDKKMPLSAFTDITGSKASKKPAATLENFTTILDHYGISIQQDLIKKDRVINVPGKSYLIDSRDDAILCDVVSVCERNKFPSAKIPQYLASVSNSRWYNPVTNWVESKPWDGEDRISMLFDCLTLDEPVTTDSDRELIRTLFTKWMVGAIACGTSTQGYKFELVLVFVGSQGCGKTQFFKSLCPLEELRTDGALLNPSDKDSVKSAISHWLVELGELDSTFKKADIAQLKAFFSKDKDTFRLPYDKTDSNFPRRTAFVASVNEHEFLRDETGNRRYIPIPVSAINFTHKIDMQQCWAQAYQLHKEHFPTYITAEEQQQLSIFQQAFEPIDPIEELLREAFDFIGDAELKKEGIQCIDAGKKYTCSQICLEIDITADKKSVNAVSKICRKLLGKGLSISNGSKVFSMPARIISDKTGFEGNPGFEGDSRQEVFSLDD